MQDIRWGIIGPRRIANKFAQDISQVSNCSLMAVASRSEKRARDFARKYGVKYAFDSYTSLVKYREVDAICIATPHSFHKEHTVLCLQHKKPMLFEKPFAMNAKEVEEMIAVSKDQNTLLIEALRTAFVPIFQEALRLIQEKSYGKIISLTADFGFFVPFDQTNRVFDKKTGGGSLLDTGIYPVFAVLSFLGIPESIWAEASFFQNNTDASCRMILRYQDAKAFLGSTLLENAPVEALIVCEHAKIKIHSRFHEPSNISIEKNGQIH